MGPHPAVLISVSSSILGGGLQSLVRSSCRSAQVVQVQDPTAISELARHLQPEMVILDITLYDRSLLTTIDAVHQSSAYSRCLVLVDDAHQVIEAEEAGADLAILKGFPARKLAAVLSELCLGVGVAS